MNQKLTIDFPCKECNEIIKFQFKELRKEAIICPSCYESYEIDKNFIDKLKRMSNLLQVIRDSKDLLSDSFISINNENNQFEVPYKILLTRFNSVIKLNIDGVTIPFKFRFQPIENKASKN